MELTTEQRDAIKSVNDWCKWLNNSLLDGDYRAAGVALHWVARAADRAHAALETSWGDAGVDDGH